MISKELFDAVADLYAPGNRDALKRQVYYDINRTLKNTKNRKLMGCLPSRALVLVVAPLVLLCFQFNFCFFFCTLTIKIN